MEGYRLADGGLDVIPYRDCDSPINRHGGVMTKRVSFSIGLSDSKGGVIPPSEVEQKQKITYHEFAREFGGYSSYQAKGGWIDPNGKEFQEDSLVVYCYADKDNLTKVDVMAEWLAGLWRQEAVMVTTEPVESMRYVSAKKEMAA